MLFDVLKRIVINALSSKQNGRDVVYNLRCLSAWFVTEMCSCLSIICLGNDLVTSSGPFY